MAKRSTYSSFVSPKTPRSVTQVIPGRQADMVQNHDGAFVFGVDHWKQLDRFLVLGAAGPSYYASRKEIVTDSAGAIEKCIHEDGARVVRRATEISVAGRAPKNDPALFVLALVASLSKDKGAKLAAYKALPQVARTGTHLFHYMQYVDDLRGWGQGPMKAVSMWLAEKKPKALAVQVIKYKQRDGWSWEDVLKTVHPRQHAGKLLTSQHHEIFNYALKGWESVGEAPHSDEALRVIWAAERAKAAATDKEIARLVSDYNLPWEAIDTKWLNSNLVWEALLPHTKSEALIRNLGRLTANGFIATMSAGLRTVLAKLTDAEALVADRMHPYKVLVAHKIYAQGRGNKGKLTWTPNQQVVAGLEDAFYKSFKAVEPSNVRTLCALDVSASMTSAMVTDAEGSPIMSAREASAAMAMVTARTEPQHYMVGWTSHLYELSIGAHMTLAQTIAALSKYPAEYTDGSLPLKWAMEKKVPVDAVVMYTDGEMNNGVHPVQMLDQYQQKMGIPCKMICVAMATNKFSVADAKRNDNLDVLGFDTASPQIIADFSAGRI